MRSKLGATLFVLIGAAIAVSPAAQCQTVHSNSSDRFGPEVTAFLELMHQEEVELDYQIKHDEITRKEYLRSRNRIAVHRQHVLGIARDTGEDRVPELHVVVATEVDQIVDGGTRALKGLKPGTIIEGKWRYIGSVMRGEAFYTFERLTGK
jgi:hypothetical protein